MSYKNIIVHVDLSSHAPARMRYAAALAPRRAWLPRMTTHRRSCWPGTEAA